MKELKGFSAVQDTLKKLVEERLTTIETRMDSFEEKVTLVEAKVSLMKKNFERNI